MAMLKRILALPVAEKIVNELVQKEVASILEICSPHCIYLFGSAARGMMTTASDLDFLVILADAADLKKTKKKYYCRKPAIEWPIDIIFIHRSAFEEKCTIGGVPMICKQEGKIVYGVCQ
jgi:predicted nucleotidyltransferase